MKFTWPVFILTLLILGQTAGQLVLYRDDFARSADPGQLESDYQKSQYVNPDSTNWIEDPPLYTLAGLRYISGADPTSINFEHHPLTKYLFGLTTIIFGNPLPFQLFLYATLIVLTFLLGRQILKSDRLALLPAVLVSLDPLIREHAHTAYLDLAVAVLILLFFVTNKRLNPWILGGLLGLIALSKSFLIGGLLFASWGIFIYLASLRLPAVAWAKAGGAQTTNPTRLWSLRGFSTRVGRRSNLIPYLDCHTPIESGFAMTSNFSVILKVIIASLAVYFLGYTAFFLHSNNLTDFFNLHLKILKLYKSYVPEYPNGEALRILLTGYWRTWWGDFGLQRVWQWWLFWPICTLGSLMSLVKMTKGKLKNLSLPMIFLVLYFGSINLKLVFPRYLIPILPLLYIFSTTLLCHFRPGRVVKIIK